jgi:hypothetical protein
MHKKLIGNMNKVLVLVTCMLFTMADTILAQEEDKENWINLFNGKDLGGWDIKFSGYPLNTNYKNTFRVEDGVLKVNYSQWDEFDDTFGHLISKKAYSYYKIFVEYRFTGKQCPGAPEWGRKNNGILIHSQPAKTMGKNQPFPVSLEVQLLGGFGEEQRPTANICTPGTHIHINGQLVTEHCTSSSSKTYRNDNWITVELIVKGNKAIHHIVEGDTVLSYMKPVVGGVGMPQDFYLKNGTPLKAGHIAIQAESHPTEFRTISLLKLDNE